MSELTASGPPLERKCSIDQVFDASFIELLQLVPTNPLVRAWVLKLTGKLPPAECLTFEQLKDWVEFNCSKRVRKKPAPDQAQEDGIRIGVDFSEQEYGRADYSVERYGHDTYQLTAEELLEIIQDTIEGGGGLGSIVDNIADRLDEDAWNQCSPDLDGYGDYSYDDHESTDSSDAETKYSRDQIRSLVHQFVQQHHPELVADL
jgi:hypothetical protein